METSWKTTRVSLPVVLLLFCAWIASLIVVWNLRINMEIDDQQALAQEFGQVVQTAAPAVVAIESIHQRNNRNLIQQHIGTGFIIAPDGYILTNEHVITQDEGEDVTISVTLADKRKFIAELIASDPRCDIAVIKIDAEDLPFLLPAPPGQLTRGQVVISLGNPGGAGADGEAVATFGRINRLNQKPTNDLDRAHDRIYDNLIMSTAITLPGNSGGPLINTLGQAIGITTAMGVTADDTYRQFGFAIALDDDTLEIVEQLRAGQTVSHAFLGVNTVDPDYDIRERLGIRDISGALVVSVPLGAPAQQAGIRSNDLIRAINNVRVYSSLDFTSKINRCQPDETVTIDLLRGANGNSTQLSFTLDLDTRSQIDMNGYNEEETLRRNYRTRSTAWGMEVINLTGWRRQKMNWLPNQRGVLVYDVIPGSPADRQNIKPGDLIVGLGENRINSLRDFNRVARRNRTLPPVKTFPDNDR